MAIRTICYSVTSSLLVFFASCTPDFEDPSLVKDLRILAVKTEPPEVMYSGSPPFDIPDDVQRDLSITVLLADPQGQQLQCLLRSCVVTSPNYRCEVENLTWILAEGPCKDGENTFEVSIPLELLRSAQKADPGYIACVQLLEVSPIPLSTCGYSGLALFIEVVVKDGVQENHALKSFVVSPEDPVGRKPNQNPVINGVKINDELLTPPVTFRFNPFQRMKFEVALSEGTMQQYVLPTFDLGVVALTEYATVSFYTDAGSFSKAKTTEEPGNPLVSKDGKAPEMWSEWTAPNVDHVRMWFVVTDGRGGVQWTTAVGIR